MAQTIRNLGGALQDIRLFHGAGALDIALAAALTSSAGVVVWGVWFVASPTIRTVARVAFMYFGNARG